VSIVKQHTAVRQPAVLAALGAALAVTFVLLPPSGGRKRSPRMSQ